MSGENGKTSTSGISPEGLRPTVIKNKIPSVLQPTVITQELLPGAAHATISAPLLQPTVIRQMEPPETVLKEVSVAKNRKMENAPVSVVTPTIISGGVTLKGVSVEVTELVKRFPGKPEETLLQVKKLLSQTFVDTLTLRACIAWGSENQGRYKQLVDTSLDVTKDKKVHDGMRHLKRLYKIFDEVYKSFPGSRRFVLFNNKSPQEVFEKHQNEINKLQNLLKELLPHLEEMQVELDEIAEEFLRVADRLDVEALAAEYIAGILDREDSQKKKTFESRSVSLIETGNHIYQGAILRSSVKTSIDTVTAKIKETILTSLPSWLEQLSFICSNQSSINETEMYNFQQIIEDILQQLQ